MAETSNMGDAKEVKNCMDCSIPCNKSVSVIDDGDEKSKSNITSSFTLILRPRFVYPSKGQMLSKTSNGFSNQFLPELFSSILDREHDVRVIAVYNDLLLCSEEPEQGKREDRDIYICNPQTKDWLMLPRPSWTYSRILAGLICEPYHSHRVNNTGYQYQYSVVCVHVGPGRYDPIEAQIFSSKTGTWNEFILSAPKPFCITSLSCGSVAYNGMLYFYDNWLGMIALDPLASPEDGESNIIQCNFVDWPTNRPFDKRGGTLITAGIYQGRLRMSEAHIGAEALWIWDLKDYRTSEWHCQHKVILRDLVTPEPCIRKFIDTKSPLNVLGFHPFCDDGIDGAYLQMHTRIVFCDLKTRRLESTFKVPKESCTMWGQPDVFYGFLLMHPQEST